MSCGRSWLWAGSKVFFFAVTPPAMSSNVYEGKVAWHSMIRIAKPGLRGAKINPSGFPGDGIATLGPEVMRCAIASGLGCGVLDVQAMQASGLQETQDLIQMLGS